MEDEEKAYAPQSLWQQVMDYQEAKAVLYDEDTGWTEKEGAVRTLERLWDEGLKVAAHQLGKCYRDGLGVLPDEDRAGGWLQWSAEAGNDYSQYALGKLLQERGRIREALRWYEEASARGNEYADYRLGKLYLIGKDVPKDVLAAVRHLAAAAELGNQYAQYTLGKLYLMGQDVPRDKGQALHWLTQAADLGNEYAQFFLERWESMGQPSVMLSVTRLLRSVAQTFRDAPLPRDATTMQPHIDRKRLKKLREKKLAMGHKPDDHESQGFTMGGMSM